MSFVVCVQCRGRMDISHNDRKFLDRSGDFVCSAQCLHAWTKKNRRNFRRNLLNHSGIFKAEMDMAADVYSPILQMGFRSGYEKSVAEWLYKKDIAFEYEPYTFLLDTDTASYTPDFYLPEYQCCLEVKGQWQRRNKVQKFREIYPVPLIVATWIIRKSFNYKSSGGGSYGGSS